MILQGTRWNRTGKSNQEEVSKLVLLHGMGGTGSLFRPIAASLEDEMELFAPDQRGHGKSQMSHIPGGNHSVTFTPLDYGRDLIETLDSLQFHPTWILGHSMGVRSAVASAYLKPEWVKGLFLIDLGFSGPAGGGLGEGLATFLKVLPPSFESKEKAKIFLAENCPDPSMAQYLLAVGVQLPEKGFTFPFDHSVLIQTIHAARDSSVRSWLEHLGSQKMPILVLRGQDSLVWSKQDFEAEKKYFESKPSMKFIEFENATHGLPFEQRQRLVTLIRETIRLERLQNSF